MVLWIFMIYRLAIKELQTLNRLQLQAQPWGEGAERASAPFMAESLRKFNLKMQAFKGVLDLTYE